MTDLGTLGGDRSWAHAINVRGEIVGSSETGERGEIRAFLWRAGRMKDLGTLGGRSSAARTINDRSEVAGVSALRSGLGHWFMWRDGRMRDLGKALLVARPARPGFRYPYETSDVEAINKRAEIVGVAQPSVSGYRRGYLWRAGAAIPLDHQCDYAVPHAINNRGVIAGQMFGINCQIATIWFGKRVVQSLPDLSRGGSLPHWSNAWALNEHGQVAGESVAAQEGDAAIPRYHAVLWTKRR
jgi:probable HAF family extracellular repeat protein